ncbi:hypothetical protein [Microbacterium sp. Y-01]|uniref:hypothetical protein n=1 Tax=Microbacterium sp. Y-01 TaxID=2048898 RepID=UPI001F14CE55|nr:hypothetical protein [Microbacterium sp. Y-01]
MSESPPPTDPQVVVAVVRSGGIAGIRRQWRVEVESSDASEWIDLIDRCPGTRRRMPTPGPTASSGGSAPAPLRAPRARAPGLCPGRPWLALVQAVRAAAA